MCASLCAWQEAVNHLTTTGELRQLVGHCSGQKTDSRYCAVEFVAFRWRRAIRHSLGPPFSTPAVATDMHIREPYDIHIISHNENSYDNRFGLGHYLSRILLSKNARTWSSDLYRRTHILVLWCFRVYWNSLAHLGKSSTTFSIATNYYLWPLSKEDGRDQYEFDSPFLRRLPLFCSSVAATAPAVAECTFSSSSSSVLVNASVELLHSRMHQPQTNVLFFTMKKVATVTTIR